MSLQDNDTKKMLIQPSLLQSAFDWGHDIPFALGRQRQTQIYVESNANHTLIFYVI